MLKIDEIITQNDDALFEGRHTIKEEISRNIGTYLGDKRLWYNLGISTDIIIKTKNNKI